ncbi:hypothetical protein CTM97_04250 [Photobacterium phosphoreum]|uniref:Uncharacterized protein n=1 Tax=Photobacterium phosphoreum TaxID=659 RepID=A0A2T3JWI4_PHOPO|nr:hypothetical protein [Photobacterium phosphoreum]PSU25758.1 hypothetical protein CTM96_08600 [Photobacterium phosphoreum]PSU43574.1 hypothetical protein CTM97_04250 [Photobacterium phosphoreum]PSU53693.1 hypothetical protein C9J18_04625 [Photobacterium phosphoreum]PSU75043.1 hypothetical protein CTM67_17010 [Photobacterium phosphoreum]
MTDFVIPVRNLGLDESDCSILGVALEQQDLINILPDYFHGRTREKLRKIERNKEVNCDDLVTISLTNYGFSFDDPFSGYLKANENFISRVDLTLAKEIFSDESKNKVFLCTFLVASSATDLYKASVNIDIVMIKDFK